MAMIAAKCPHIRVDVVDLNAERIAAWNSDELPVYEPGLDDLVRGSRGKNLFFSTEVKTSIHEADIIFVSVNTPTKTFGVGAHKAADLRFIEAVARTIAEVADSPKIIVEKSTIPVRTAEAIKTILASSEKALKHQVLSNPEFLAEGTAVVDLTLSSMTSPDATLQAALSGADGSAAGLSVTDSGAITALRLKPSANSANAARAAIEQALGQAVYRTVALPDAPVGVGARWVVRQQVSSEILLDQTTTVTLTATDLDNLTTSQTVAVTINDTFATWAARRPGRSWPCFWRPCSPSSARSMAGASATCSR